VAAYGKWDARVAHGAVRGHNRFMPDLQAHPHFDDQGTLDWTSDLDEGLARAKAAGKGVLIEFGRAM